MALSRMVRVNELLKREIAEDLYRNFYDADFDTTALTVTRVECDPIYAMQMFIYQYLDIKMRNIK